MTTAIIQSGLTTCISTFAKKMVYTAIESTNNSYKIFDLNSIEFKCCTQEECLERDFDRTVRFGCKKYSTCIEEHNGSMVDSICNEISICESFIFLIQNKSSSRKFGLFFDEYSKKKSARQLEGKKCLLIFLPDENGYSFGVSGITENVKTMLSKKLKMEVVDSFIFDEKTGNYMAEVIPIAIRAYATNIERIEHRFTDHMKMVRFSDMHDLSPETLACLSESGIVTVGELAERNGEEIFEILEKVYRRVTELFLSYLDNRIPTEFLDEVMAVAEDYRKSEMAKYYSRVKELKETLSNIEKQVNKIKTEFERIKEESK